MQPHHAIESTIRRVVSKWAQMTVDPTEVAWSLFDSAEPVVVATVYFSGPFEGFFRVLAQRTFMQTIVQKMFDEDENLSERELLDATKELSNVLTGNLLTELYGVDTVFQLETPSVAVTDVGRLASEDDPRRMFFLCDSNPMGFTFRVEG